MKKTLLSWSSGKDSAWTLQLLKNAGDVELLGLFTTMNEAADRVAMHAVRRRLIELQGEAAGLPVDFIALPHPCSNDQYTAAMNEFMARARERGIDCFAYGDLLLQDVRRWREEAMQGSGIAPIFPLWGSDTAKLAHAMIDAGLRARITCIDPRQMPVRFAGRDFDRDLLAELPASVDPCGENGEFHSFAYAGPMFRQPIGVRTGQTIERDGFVFTDLLPAEE